MTADWNGRETLQEMYEMALSVGSDITSWFTAEESENLRTILEYHETRKAVPTVLITLLLKKLIDPYQDIRNHQAGMPGGFSGRKLDTETVTPFLKDKQFPSMSESGWLTRSLEQAHPYDMNYPGQITPKKLKSAFLYLVSLANSSNSDKVRKILLFLFDGFIKARDKSANLVLSRPVNLSIADVVDKLRQHHGVEALGAARLPVLAMHSILTVLARETERYRMCKVLPLQAHTASDTKTRLIGDVNILDANGALYEGYEIKHNVRITSGLIHTSFQKLQTTPVQRFYILTTYPHDNYDEFSGDIRHVAQSHGCQLIVNGVDRTLLYYLRIIGSTRSFIDAYVSHLESDENVNFQLKESWNQIATGSS